MKLFPLDCYICAAPTERMTVSNGATPAQRTRMRRICADCDTRFVRPGREPDPVPPASSPFRALGESDAALRARALVNRILDEEKTPTAPAYPATAYTTVPWRTP